MKHCHSVRTWNLNNLFSAYVGGQRSHLITREQFFLGAVAVSTVVAAAGEIKLSGFSLRGWAWLLILVLSAFYLIPRKRQEVKLLWYTWLPWFLWVAYKTDFTDMAAVQRLFIFMTPVFVLYASASLENITVDLIRRSYRLLWIGSACIYGIAVVQCRSLLTDVEWYSIAGIAMTFTLIAVAAVACISSGSKQGYITFIVCLLILFATQSRMPVLILPTILVFGCTGISLRVRTILCIVLICAGIFLFNSQPVQEDLFRRGYGTVHDAFSFDPEVVNLSGRLTAWPLFIQGIENIWFGDGSTASVVFGNATFGACKWSHPHNAYIRVLFDYGIMGFILLLIPVVSLLIFLYKRYQQSHTGEDSRWIYAVSINGIVAMLLLGISGNVLMYVPYIGNMLFATIGCAFACERKKKERRPRYENLFDSQ
jgi:hypothetical protein